jgi:hypothetical protein
MGEQPIDLVEATPAEPSTCRVLNMLDRSCHGRRIEDLRDEIDDRLGPRASLAEIRIGGAPLKAVAKAPATKAGLFNKIGLERTAASVGLRKKNTYAKHGLE